MPDKGGRPRATKGTKAVPVNATPKMLEYLDEIVAMEGYGSSRAEVARNFVWREINRLLEVGRLQSKS